MSAARQFAIDSARMLAHTRCHQVVILDVREISPVTDFLVLASGTSPRQMKTAIDDVADLGEERDFRALSRVGDESGTWYCADCFLVVIHVFSQDGRLHYDLDSLWGDAKRVEWDE